MAKYVKKPVIINAFQFKCEDAPQWYVDAIICGEITLDEGSEKTVFVSSEGIMSIQEGDYIIKGLKGEFYVCPKSVFIMTYDPIWD